MKKTFYLIVLIATFTALKSKAQYHITSHNWYQDTSKIGFLDVTLLANLGLPSTDTPWFCNTPILSLTTNAFDTGLTVRTYFGDGTYCTQPVVDSGTYGYLSCNSFFFDWYLIPGTYSIKQVLYHDGLPVDSISGYVEHFLCGTAKNISYFDLSGAGHFVPGTDEQINLPFQYVVDSDGIAIDTVGSSGSFYYNWRAGGGTIYGFKQLPVAGLTSVTPSGGINYDTIVDASNQAFLNYTGNLCSTSGFDLAVYASSIAGRHHSHLSIEVDKLSCTPGDATVTFNFSPKYNFTNAYPTPISVVGNTITWMFPAASLHSPQNISVSMDIPWPAPYLTPGDTVNYDLSVTPTTGDLNLANNYMVIVDTIKSSYDPNEIAVMPGGTITAGTQLKYTIGFENTGNDTAFNISVYDTLSPNVDVRSLRFVSASAYTTMTTLWYNGQTIVKFDFPHINLLDSSHHNQCDGMLIFTVNTKNGLPNGTTIFNHAGIIFDDNPVVLTDTVENTIGIPASVTPVDRTSKVSVYPNPAGDEVTISAENASYAKATVTNVLGQQVQVVSLTGPQTKMNISHLTTGMYYITLAGAGGVKVMKLEKR